MTSALATSRDCHTTRSQPVWEATETLRAPDPTSGPSFFTNLSRLLPPSLAGRYNCPWRVSLAGQPLLRRSAAPYHAHRGRSILPFRPPNAAANILTGGSPAPPRAGTVFIFFKPRPTAADAPRRSLALLRSGLTRFAEPALIFGIDADIMSFGAGCAPIADRSIARLGHACPV